MTRGALVSSGVVIAVTDAADGLNLHYQTDADGNWVAFVPDATADVGDSWDGSSFTYQHVPQTVTMLQARLAIDNAGLARAVAAAIATQPQAIQDAWNFSTTVNRTDALISSIGASLGLTSAQIDALFRAASVAVAP